MVFGHALGGQDEAVEQRGQDFLQANAKGRVAVGAHQLRDVPVIASGEFQDKAHML